MNLDLGATGNGEALLGVSTDILPETMIMNRSRLLHAAAATILAGAMLTACAVVNGTSVAKENVYSEAIESAEAIATPEGITAEEAKERGVFSSDGDALISGYAVKSNDRNLTVTVDVNNVSEVEDVYEVKIVTEDGRKATNGGLVPAESTVSFEIIIQGPVEGDIAIILNGKLMGERIDAEALNLS